MNFSANYLDEHTPVVAEAVPLDYFFVPTLTGNFIVLCHHRTCGVMLSDGRRFKRVDDISVSDSREVDIAFEMIIQQHHVKAAAPSLNCSEREWAQIMQMALAEQESAR